MKVRLSSLKMLAALGAMLSLLVVGTASGAVNGVSATAITLTANLNAGASHVANADNTDSTGHLENQVFISVTDAGANLGGSAIDTLTVSVVNTTRNVTVEITLSETGVDTGIFGVTTSDHEGFQVVPVADENITQPESTVDLLGANDGDIIEVRSTPLFKKITVDAKGPVISGFAPVHNAVTKATTVFFSGTITDDAAKLATQPTGTNTKPSSTAVVFTVTKAGSALSGSVVFGATTWTKTTTEASGAAPLGPSVLAC